MKHINEMKWYCFLGKHEVIGGSRYADHKGHFNCALHIPYLAK